MIQKKRMPESFHVSTTLCCRLLLYFVTSTKHTAFHTVFKKVSFGQPARQESDKKIVTIHWKTIPYQETLVFRVFFSSSIMELQKCSLANPNREVLEQSHVYQLGLVDTGGFGSVGYLAFEFFLELTNNQTKIKTSILHKHRFALVSERAAWLVQMVRIHS